MALNFASWDAAVVALCLALTLLAAWHARRVPTARGKSEALAGRSLGSWLLGLSAGADANSGVVLTAAVAMGYTGGLKWMLFALAWLLGDILFWYVFAGRINAISRRQGTVTLPEFLSANALGRNAALVLKSVAALLVLLLTAYIGGQWLAAGKIAGSLMQVDAHTAALVFGTFVVG